MISAKQLIKNAARLTMSSVIRKVMTFFYFMLIARLASVETTGLYFLMVSFAALFSSFMDFGFSLSFFLR
jgi:O-antigen/teichoic acid export membrane protein